MAVRSFSLVAPAMAAGAGLYFFGHGQMKTKVRFFPLPCKCILCTLLLNIFKWFVTPSLDLASLFSYLMFVAAHR